MINISRHAPRHSGVQNPKKKINNTLVYISQFCHMHLFLIFLIFLGYWTTMFGGMVRYFNLSCDPNCVTKMLDVNCDLHNIILANQQILQGLIMCKSKSTFTVSITQLGSQEWLIYRALPLDIVASQTLERRKKNQFSIKSFVDLSMDNLY